MRNRSLTIWMMAMGVCQVLILSNTCLATLYSDGGNHTIIPSKDDGVFVTSGTHVDVISGGWSGEPISVRDNSTLNMYGGSFLCGGFYDDTVINFYGGNLWNGFGAEDRAVINIYDFDIPGGTGSGQMFIFDDAVVTVYGENFSWGYGSFNSPTVWGTILTGTLADGDTFEWKVYTGTSGGSGMAPPARDAGTLILAPVPEPATLLLLGLGAVMLRRKHRLFLSA